MTSQASHIHISNAGSVVRSKCLCIFHSSFVPKKGLDRLRNQTKLPIHHKFHQTLESYFHQYHLQAQSIREIKKTVPNGQILHKAPNLCPGPMLIQWDNVK